MFLYSMSWIPASRGMTTQRLLKKQNVSFLHNTPGTRIFDNTPTKYAYPGSPALNGK